MTLTSQRTVSGNVATYKLTNYDDVDLQQRVDPAVLELRLERDGINADMRVDFDNGLDLKLVDKNNVTIGGFPRPRPA